MYRSRFLNSVHFYRIYPYSDFVYPNYHFQPKPTKNWTIDNGYSTPDEDVFPKRLVKHIFSNEDYGIVYTVYKSDIRESIDDWIGFKVK